MKNTILLFLLFLTIFPALSQRITRRYSLCDDLNEISGLERLNDTVLIAINDSGNAPDIYFLSLTGKVLKKTRISNAENVDWEDLSSDDKGNLYIADTGNNTNTRQDLSILKVNANAAFLSDSIEVERIFFTYQDQKAYPPEESKQRFNCEAIYWRNDSIHLLTKINPNIEGKTQRQPDDYIVPAFPGNHQAIKCSDSLNYLISVGKKGIQDQVTSVECKYNKIAVLTYTSLTILPLESNVMPLQIAGKIKRHRFKRLTQKESVLLFSEKQIFLAAEKHKFLGGPYLYKVKLP